MTNRKQNLNLTFIALGVFCVSAATQAASLTSDQKMTALTTFQSLVLATSAIDSLNPAMTPGNPGQDAISQKFVQMSTLLKGSCQKQVPSNGSFKVFGPNCQVSYDEENQTPANSMNTTSTTTYQATDSNYAAMNDIDSFTMNNTQTVKPNDSTFQVSVQGGGTLHSQQMGTLNFTISGGGTFDFSGSGNLQITITAQFPGFVADFQENATSVQDGTPSMSYVLNGVALTPDEVSTYINPAFVPTSPTFPGHVFGTTLR